MPCYLIYIIFYIKKQKKVNKPLLFFRIQVNAHRTGTVAFSNALTTLEGSHKVLDLLVRYNQLDLELYAYARSRVYTDLLNERLSKGGSGKDPDQVAQMRELLKIMGHRRTGAEADKGLHEASLQSRVDEMAGRGGNTSACGYVGFKDLNNCQYALITSMGCHALTLGRGGQCVLHNMSDTSFKVVPEPGSKLQVLKSTPPI